MDRLVVPYPRQFIGNLGQGNNGEGAWKAAETELSTSLPFPLQTIEWKVKGQELTGKSAALEFVDGVGEVAAATPSGVSLLLLCPCCCGVVSNVLVEQGGFVVQKRCRLARVSDLKFEGMSRSMLPQFDSFNDNGFASDKLLWRSVKLYISDGAALSSGEEASGFVLFDGCFDGIEGER
ncbi:Endo-1,3(4)-beta-glucanase 1 [Hordeum vulgare]|nr:Endo-1,3(4)-beta-glucanase 1 [Hordeum vulgare]